MTGGSSFSHYVLTVAEASCRLLKKIRQGARKVDPSALLTTGSLPCLLLFAPCTLQVGRCSEATERNDTPCETLECASSRPSMNGSGL